MRLLDLGAGADVMGSAQTPRTPPTLIHPSTEPTPPADSGQRCLKRRGRCAEGGGPQAVASYAKYSLHHLPPDS